MSNPYPAYPAPPLQRMTWMVRTEQLTAIIAMLLPTKRCGDMIKRFYSSQAEFDNIHLKQTPCPHCKRVGPLIRYGFLRGYDENHQHHRTVRARRVFCNNRKRARGCGRTFSVWAADKIRRLSLTATTLWAFLKRAIGSGNKLDALRSLACGLSDSAPYRIWRRFDQAQSSIRTAIARRCQPPSVPGLDPARQTVAHLQVAFPNDPCPIAAFQQNLQTFFL